MHIYNLRKNKPVRVIIPTNPSLIVVTDGFHITKPMQLKYTNRHTCYYNIVCAIDNDLLIGGLIFMLMLFAMGMTSGLFVLQVISTLPVLYMLVFYYIKRKDFIQLRPV